MKKSLLLLSLVATTASAFAQTAITNNWFIRVNDQLFAATDSSTQTSIGTASATAQMWDYTQLTPTTKDTFEVFTAASGGSASVFPTATMRIPILNGDGYVRQSAGKTEVIGFAGDILNVGQSFNIPFTDPLELQIAPMSYGNTYNNTSSFRFQIKPSDYPAVQAFLVQAAGAIANNIDSVRVRRDTKTKDVVDAFGMVMLSAGNYDVLRLNRTDINDTNVFFKLPFLGWQNASSLGQAIPGTGKDTIYAYHFVSNTERQNIATVTMNRTGGIASTRYLFAPTVVATNAVAVNIVEWSATPNPASTSVFVKVGDLPQGNYEVKVYSLLGQTVAQSVIVANGFTSFDVSRLANGIYMYALIDAGGRAIATKRIHVAH